MPPIASSLTVTGVFWACISLAAAILSCAGFYLPFWIKGTLSDGTEVSFGSFRRCNYPRLTDGKLEMVHECGRYTSFPDIPSVSWQVTTVTVGVGAAISLLVAFTALSACCLADVVTKTTARILGLVQLISDSWDTLQKRSCTAMSSGLYLQSYSTCKRKTFVKQNAGMPEQKTKHSCVNRSLKPIAIV